MPVKTTAKNTVIPLLGWEIRKSLKRLNLQPHPEELGKSWDATKMGPDRLSFNISINKFPGQILGLKQMKENKTSPSVFWWNFVFQWTLCFSEWQNCFSKLGGIPLQIHSSEQTESLAWNDFLHSSCRKGFRSLTVLIWDQKVWGAWGHEDHLKQKRALESYC